MSQVSFRAISILIRPYLLNFDENWLFYNHFYVLKSGKDIRRRKKIVPLIANWRKFSFWQIQWLKHFFMFQNSRGYDEYVWSGSNAKYDFKLMAKVLKWNSDPRTFHSWKKWCFEAWFISGNSQFHGKIYWKRLISTVSPWTKKTSVKGFFTTVRQNPGQSQAFFHR